MSRGEWAQARCGFEAVLADGESPEALEGLAEAAWWLEDAAAVFATRQRAYQLYRQRGDDPRAGRVATELGFDHVVYRLELAVANGWFQRAHRLLDGLDACEEQVWLLLREAELAYHTAADMAHTRALAADARGRAARLGLLDLEMMALALEGLAQVGLAEVAEGMRRLDEATAAAVAGELAELKAAAAICCFTVFACERVRDVDRASQWCEQYMAFCRRNHMPGYLAFCRGHHASVLVARGRWTEAEAALERSRATLHDRVAWSLTVLERLGELRRRQGRLAEAAQLFEAASPYLGAVLGAARLDLDRSEPESALDRVEGVLARVPERDRLERVAAVELLVRCRVALGQPEAAESAVIELEALAGSAGTDCLAALAEHCRGQVALAAGDAAAARAALERALDRYQRARMPYETALARLDLARSLHALGRRDAAVDVARAAGATLEQLGARLDAPRARALLRELAGAGPVAGLSPREIEVLRLLARGLSNQQIADELVVSRHTIRRHVSNILTKLGVSSRTAAVAKAHERHLL